MLLRLHSRTWAPEEASSNLTKASPVVLQCPPPGAVLCLLLRNYVTKERWLAWHGMRFVFDNEEVKESWWLIYRGRTHQI